jgi:hypothetical protein
VFAMKRPAVELAKRVAAE